MNREPYTYSMPEAFIEDQSVPARWRVWAVINGFFINGGYCWASNDWIAERVKSHKDTVSQAVKELEEKEIIRCERGARSRSIYPMIGTNAYLRSVPTPISDRHQRLSNSDSNSESINSVSLRSTDTLEIVEVSEEDSSLPGESAKRPRVSGDKRKAYDELIAWSENERGFPFLKTARGKQYAAFKIANENGITRDELIERWEEMSTEKFWKQNGYDWMNVVTSFNTKRV